MQPPQPVISCFVCRSLGLLRRKRHTIPLFLFCLPLRLGQGALVRPPNNPTPTGLHPVTPLGYGPRLGYLFPTSLRSGRKQIETRGETTVLA